MLQGVWIGKTHAHTNFVPSLQTPDSPCVSMKASETYDKMDKVECTMNMQFICKKKIV